MPLLLSCKPKIYHKTSYRIDLYFNYNSKKIKYKNNNLN